MANDGSVRYGTSARQEYDTAVDFALLERAGQIDDNHQSTSLRIYHSALLGVKLHK